MTDYINGQWQKGSGSEFQSTNPATNEKVWSGCSSSEAQIDLAVDAARAAGPGWMMTPLEQRIAIVRAFGKLLETHAEAIAETIARETGKPLWESRTEAAAMKGKIELSIKAYNERTGMTENSLPGARTFIRHKPHGVVAVFGPYNFPDTCPTATSYPPCWPVTPLSLNPAS